jgi:ubiquinone/menaquinone biosynthesis C-methylase UbiE
MDALSMDFENQFFDVVIDKAMLDSVLCADGGFQKATEVIREIYRVLKHDGVYFIVSN